MDDLDLRGELDQHKRNLQRLELQAAEHGPPVPLSVLNAIDAERSSIQDLEQKIANQAFPEIDQQSKGQQRNRKALQTMAEIRVDRIEAALLTVDQKIDRLADQIHNLDVRATRIELHIQQLQADLVQLRQDLQSEITKLRSEMQGEIGNLRHQAKEAGDVYLSRSLLVGGGLTLFVMLVLMIIVTWRVF